ncbi:hypothetical protein FQN49_001517 [Arthroderma sp. PD_2]|nr:hypothetical protein FQN49_001517 [Arthroderma sp. PD_2]
MASNMSTRSTAGSEDQLAPETPKMPETTLSSCSTSNVTKTFKSPSASASALERYICGTRSEDIPITERFYQKANAEPLSTQPCKDGKPADRSSTSYYPIELHFPEHPSHSV